MPRRLSYAACCVPATSREVDEIRSVDAAQRRLQQTPHEHASATCRDRGKGGEHRAAAVRLKRAPPIPCPAGGLEVGRQECQQAPQGAAIVSHKCEVPPVCKRRLQIAHILESVQFRSALTPRGAQPFDHYRCVNGGNRSPDRIQISFERAPPSLVLGGGRGSHFARCGPGSIHPTPLFEKGGGSARAHAAGANALGGSAQ